VSLFFSTLKIVMTKETKTALGVLVIFLIVAFIIYILAVKSSSSSSLNSSQTTMSTTTSGTAVAPVPGLTLTDEVVGGGALAQQGMTATVQYTGTLTNGKKFDSSYDHGAPFSFLLGGGQVIKGWDLGVVGMRVGGKRKLVIAPELGYGAQNVGGGLIPANSTLIFEVELVSVK
jgi:FKBP-type peptidyl-prolyl cis-trans isomerase FkpA